jgi:G:T-mismatch repair DNA endonuclease (very short patch repair protein)
MASLSIILTLITLFAVFYFLYHIFIYLNKHDNSRAGECAIFMIFFIFQCFYNLHSSNYYVDKENREFRLEQIKELITDPPHEATPHELH